MPMRDRTRSRRLVVGLAGLWLGVAVCVHAQTQGTSGGEWPSYGGHLGNTRYSPLDPIAFRLPEE